MESTLAVIQGGCCDNEPAAACVSDHFEVSAEHL
jgi:hypothetical protein